jgi:hypothetical protein
MTQELPAGFDATDMDMIRRGDMLGPRLGARAADALEEKDRLRDALEQIEQWSHAYPLKAFPEPDFGLARDLLAAGGITIDAVSASNMRHVVTQVGRMARAALKRSTP